MEINALKYDKINGGVSSSPSLISPPKAPTTPHQTLAVDTAGGQEGRVREEGRRETREGWKERWREEERNTKMKCIKCLRVLGRHSEKERRKYGRQKKDIRKERKNDSEGKTQSMINESI